MLLRRLHLYTADLPALAGFYADALGIAVVEHTADQLVLRVGRTELTFAVAPLGSAPTYHLAFNVPADSLPAAGAWLSAQVPLLAYEGRTTVDFPNWKAQSVYAFDPAGNIIECIARHELASTVAGEPFSAADLLNVSEIGVVVPDVAAFVAECRERHGLSLFARQPPQPRFAALGDDHGLLIVVPPGRVWFPTVAAVSAEVPLAIELELPGGRLVRLRWP